MANTHVLRVTRKRLPIIWVKAELNYYASFPVEIELSIEDRLAADFETLQNALPNAQVFEFALLDER